MRILFVLGGFRVGGYEILTVRLANTLSENNNEIAILSLSSERAILDKVNRKVVTYRTVRKHKYDVVVVTNALRVLKEFDPDLVVSCAYYEYFIVRVLALLYPGKAKFLLSFHATEPYDMKEKCWNRLYGIMTRFFNDYFVAIHNSQRHYYSTEYGLPAHRFTLIHNGVDTEYFQPSKRTFRRRDGVLRVVHVANLKPLKDQWTLLKSVVELDKTHKKWHLRVAGADQCGMLKAYEEFVIQRNLTGKVKFLGAVSDTRAILRDADVFVLTSVTEALPMSVLEAIAMGLPCIVTDIGGNPDIIEDGKQGFLVRPGDYKAIAGCLRKLIENPGQRRKIGLSARDKAVKEFGFSTMVDRYDALFHKIIHA